MKSKTPEFPTIPKTEISKYFDIFKRPESPFEPEWGSVSTHWFTPNNNGSINVLDALKRMFDENNRR